MVAYFLFFLITACVTPLAMAVENNERDPREFFFIQSFGDMPAELQTAREQGKAGLLLFFEAEGCSYCQAMLKRVLNQKRVQDWYRQHFLSIAVDIHGDVEITDFDNITLPSKVFAEHRKVFLTPVVSFINLEGAEIYRHAGMITSPDEFLVIGEYIAGKHYLDTEFEVFAGQQGMQTTSKSLTTSMQDSARTGVEK